jgi:hypothetical protein
VGSVNKPTTTLKLTLAAFAERRKIGQCFHCNDMYTDDHRDVCMQLFFIEVLVADDNQAPAAGTDDLTISLHVLIGICPGPAAPCNWRSPSTRYSSPPC